MAAGLGFKDFTTGEVLTAADVDGYLMQGVWVFADATARNAAVTSPQEGNFAYLKDTNVTTYYTGSAWANLDTTGMTNPMTTTGDTIYSSSGSTPARLGIGTAGQVLQVNSGATAPEWATPASGGMTLLSTTSLTGASTTISGISGTYTDLQIVLQGITAATANGKIRIAPNGSTSISSQSGGDGNATDFRRVANSYILLEDFKQTNRTNSQNSFTVKISRYATADSVKSFIISGAFEDDGGGRGGTIYGGGITTSSAISSLEISYSGGDFSAGTAYVYGVK
jgi:hypothetical protein